jgi:predicted Zn-dependent protease
MQHGIKELRDRRAKIRQSEAFAELDDILDYDERKDDEYVRVSNELGEFTDQVYEYLRKDKLEAYETEADAIGFTYMARAGYFPGEGMKLLNRFIQRAGDYAKKEKGNLDWQGLSLQKRIQNAQSSVGALQRNGVAKGVFASEWQEKVGRL